MKMLGFIAFIHLAIKIKTEGSPGTIGYLRNLDKTGKEVLPYNLLLTHLC
jgi:hypothetical protein